MKPVKAFTIERSTYEAIAYLPNNIRLEVYDAIMQYVFVGVDPEENLKPIARCVFCLIRPAIDFNLKQRRNGSQPKRVNLLSAETNILVPPIDFGETVMSLQIPSAESLSCEPETTQDKANSKPVASQTQANCKPTVSQTQEVIDDDDPMPIVAERPASEELTDVLAWAKERQRLSEWQQRQEEKAKIQANSKPVASQTQANCKPNTSQNHNEDEKEEIPPTPPKEEKELSKEKNSLKRVKKERSLNRPTTSNPKSHDSNVADGEVGGGAAIDGFLDWLKDNAPYIARNFSHTLTSDELKKLKQTYGSERIAETILQIENRKDLRKRYTNLYRTLLNWLKNEKYAG
jgi:hypothetical protein